MTGRNYTRDFNQEFNDHKPYFKSYEDYPGYIRDLNEKYLTLSEENRRNAIKLTKSEFYIARANTEAKTKYDCQIYFLRNAYLLYKEKIRDEFPMSHRNITDIFVIAACTLRHGSFPVMLQRELMEHQNNIDQVEDEDVKYELQKKVCNLTAIYRIPAEVWINIWKYFFAMEPFICFKNSCRRIFFQKESKVCPDCHSPKLKTISISEI